MKQHTAKKVLAGLLGAVLLSTSIPFATVTAADAETGAIIYSSDFEDSSASLPFTGRGGVESISITDSQAHSGSSSMMVSDRSKGWHGPQLLLDDICEPNKEYTVSAFAKPEWYNSIKLSLEYTDAAGERHYSNLATETSNGDWVEFSNIKFSFTSEVSKVYVYFECNDISNCILTTLPSQKPRSFRFRTTLPLSRMFIMATSKSVLRLWLPTWLLRPSWIW